MNIRYRNIQRNENNVIISGSASLVENFYFPNPEGNRNKNHTKQKVIEQLGKVVWKEEDGTCGIFNSPTRGLVFYDLNKDEFTQVEMSDPRLKGTPYQLEPARIHTNFGNAYLFFSMMEKTPFMNVLRKSFTDPQLYQKALAHLAHDCLKNGASIKCGEYLKDSMLSYLVTDIPFSILDCDSAYFRDLSDDNVKTDFFRNLIQEIRKEKPEFGHSCYVDSTPLPGEAENNPFNALCSHGTDGAVIQSRLVLVLDIQTSVPVWFEIIPANVLDKSTIMSIADDVKTTLDITIDMYDLDAGYARKELFQAFNINNNSYIDEDNTRRDHTVLVRMPAINGYPRDDLYIKCKPHFNAGRYSFDYESHTFFGERVEIELFGYPEYAFVIVDKTQAESLLRHWRTEHLDEWNELSDSAQDWYMVKDGFFVLIGNKDQTPKEALVEYRSRAKIEGFFRDIKTYLKALPLGKWNKKTVTGKIFHDVIETIFYRSYREQIAVTSKSMSELIVCLDSWECYLKDSSMLEIKTPRTQTREILEKLGYTVPAHLDLDAFRREIMEGIPMTREPITHRTRKTSKPSLPISPEEKIAERSREQTERQKKEAQRKLEKAEAKAEKNLAKAEASAEEVLAKKIARANRQYSKVEASAKRSQTLEKAKAVLKEAISDAKAECNRAKAEARKNCTRIKQEARKKYDLEIAAAERNM